MAGINRVVAHIWTQTMVRWIAVANTMGGLELGGHINNDALAPLDKVLTGF